MLFVVLEIFLRHRSPIFGANFSCQHAALLASSPFLFVSPSLSSPDSFRSETTLCCSTVDSRLGQIVTEFGQSFFRRTMRNNFQILHASYEYVALPSIFSFSIRFLFAPSSFLLLLMPRSMGFPTLGNPICSIEESRSHELIERSDHVYR